MYLISAVAGVVGFSTAANADISVSGSGGVAVVNDGDASTNNAYISSGVAFALTTTTANGLGISMGMGISESSADDSTNVTGGDAVTFTTGGATIVVGVVDTVGTVGGVGGVNSDWVDNSTIAADASTDIAVTSGEGFTLSTAMGGATLTVGYVADGAEGDGVMDLTDSADTSAGASISMPMGNMTATVGFANADTDDESETHVGGSVALAAGGGTLTVGMAQASLDGGDATSMGVTYAMSLDADTALSVGYNNTKDADHNDTTTELSLSRSLGGGASVFFDMVNVSGDADTNALGTAFAIGSSFSF
jgi:hypothetical protein